ncbi:hypothetical protein ACQP1P_18220 [Dactylosporangium sp. CA-052675]
MAEQYVSAFAIAIDAAEPGRRRAVEAAVPGAAGRAPDRPHRAAIFT